MASKIHLNLLGVGRPVEVYVGRVTFDETGCYASEQSRKLSANLRRESRGNGGNRYYLDVANMRFNLTSHGPKDRVRMTYEGNLVMDVEQLSPNNLAVLNRCWGAEAVRELKED